MMNTRSTFSASNSCSKFASASMPIALTPLRCNDASTALPLSSEISRSAERPPMTTATMPYARGARMESVIAQTFCGQLLAQHADIACALRYQNVAVLQLFVENTFKFARQFDEYGVELAA